MYDIYKQLGLDKYGVDFEWFSDLIHSMVKNIYQRVKNPFVHPKYFSYDPSLYIASYYDNPKRKKFIIDYFHEPEKVFEIFGPFHPLIYGEVFSLQSYLAQQVFHIIDGEFFVDFDDLLDTINNLIQFLQSLLDYPTKFNLDYVYVDEYDMYKFSFDFPFLKDLKKFATFYEPSANLYPRLKLTIEVNKCDRYCFSDGFFVYYLKQHPIEFLFDDVVNSNEVLHRLQQLLVTIGSYKQNVYYEVLFPVKEFHIVDKEQRRAFKVVTQNLTTVVQQIDFKYVTHKVLETLV